MVSGFSIYSIFRLYVLGLFDVLIIFDLYHRMISLDLCMKFSRYMQVIAYLSGDEGIRTPDPLLARQVLSQLSYTPRCMFYLIKWA